MNYRCNKKRLTWLVLTAWLVAGASAGEFKSQGNGVAYNSKNECFVFGSIEDAKLVFSSETLDTTQCSWQKITFSDGESDTTEIPSSDYSFSADGKSVTLKNLNANSGYLIKYKDDSCDEDRLCDAFTWVTEFRKIEKVTWPKDTVICGDLELELFPVMTYHTRYGEEKKISRNLRLKYLTLVGKDKDDPVVEEVTEENGASRLLLLEGMPFVDTPFKIEDLLAKSLNTGEEILTDTFFTQAVVAFPKMLTSSDQEHEGDEGTDSTFFFKSTFEEAHADFSKFRSSGPVELNLLSRANDMTNHYEWAIIKGAKAQQGDFRGAFVLFERDVNAYRLTEPGLYCIELTVSNIRNDSVCAHKSYGCLRISTSELMVPNAFTPDGDGTNDEFRVAYRSIEKFSCWIYDQWGRKVYESDDITKGWDGTVGGKLGDLGAYYYVIKATGTDGVEYVKKGTVNLLRDR